MFIADSAGRGTSSIYSISIKVKGRKATSPSISWSISFPPWNVRQANKINKNGFCKTLKTFPSSFR